MLQRAPSLGGQAKPADFRSRRAAPEATGAPGRAPRGSRKRPLRRGGPLLGREFEVGKSLILSPPCGLWTASDALLGAAAGVSGATDHVAVGYGTSIEAPARLRGSGGLCYVSCQFPCRPRIGCWQRRGLFGEKCHDEQSEAYTGLKKVIAASGSPIGGSLSKMGRDLSSLGGGDSER